MEFHEILKELIQLTDAMAKDISNCVQYDQSYISKWLSGTKLPTEKSSDYVISQLSHYFAKLIVERKKEGDLRDLVPVPLNLDHAGDVENVIRGLLENGYYFSLIKENDGYMEEPTTKLIMGRNEAVRYSLDIIKRHLSYHQEPSEMIITIDIFDLLPELNLESFDIVFTKPLDISISTIIDIDKYKTNYYERTRSILALVNQTINVNYTLYANGHNRHNNLVVMKDHFVLMYYLDERGDVAACLYISDPEFVQMVYTHVSASLVNNLIVLRSTSGQKLRNIDYALDFLTSPPYRLFTSMMVGLFLDEDMIKNHKNDFHPEVYPNMLFINSLVKEKLKDVELLILTSRSYIIKFLKTGQSMFLGENFNLTREERRRYLDNILEAMENNPNIKFYISQDDLSPLYTSKINLSLALTDNKALIIKNPNALYNQRFPYYMVTSPQFIKMINTYVDSLINMHPIKGISNEDTKLLLKQFKTMFKLNS